MDNTQWTQPQRLPLQANLPLLNLLQSRYTLLVLLCSLGTLGCMRERRPDGPYRDAQELVDALSDISVDCTREHAPDGAAGQVLVAADLSQPGAAPTIHDAGSSAGTEPIVACIQAGAQEKLRSPSPVPAPYAKIRVPLPLETAKVRYSFAQQLPQAAPNPQEPSEAAQ